MNTISDQMLERIVNLAEAEGLTADEYLGRVLSRQRQFAESAHEGIWEIDLAGNTLYANQQMADILGYSRTELSDMSLWDVISFEDREDVQRRLAARGEGEGEQHDFRFVHKDGRDVWVLIKTDPLFDEEGRPYGAIGFISDITRRVEVENHLKQRERRHRQVSELMTDYAFGVTVQADGRLVNEWVTGAFQRITGAQLPPRGSDVMLTMVLPEDRPQLEQDLERVIQWDERVTSEYRIQRHDGHVIWLQVTRQPVWDEEQQRVVSFYGAAKDITEQRMYDIQLRENKEILLAINEMSSDYAYSFAVLPDGSLSREWNTTTSFKRITGYSVDEIDQMGGWQTFVHPEDLPGLVEVNLQQLERPVKLTYIYRINTKDGRVRHMKSISRSIADVNGRVVRIVGSAQDITEQVKARQELEESEARFKMLTNNAPVMIWLDDPNGHCIYVNQTWLTFTGRSWENEVGSQWSAGIHPDDLPRLKIHYKAVRVGESDQPVDYRLLRHDGVYRWIREHAVLRYLPNGDFAGYIGASFDVTEIRDTQQALERLVAEQTEHLQIEIAQRGEAERELKQEHDLLEKVIRTSPAAILRIGIDGQIKFASERAGQVFETTLGNILTSTLTDAYDYIYEVDGSRLASFDVLFHGVLANGEPSYGRELLLISDEGKHYILSVNIAPLFDDGGQVSEFILTVEDVTLQKQVEANMAAALEKERKLNAMRQQFISLVTHEFKNPLTVIQVSCDILRRRHGRLTEEQFLQRLRRIEKQGVRLTELVNDILHLHQVDGGQYQLQRAMINLHDLIHHIAEEVQIAYDDAVQVLIKLEGPEYVFLDNTLIYKLLSNLLGNAVKYSPAGEVVEVVYRQAADHLILTVQDNGIGIPERDQQYLFTDFFRAGNVENEPGTGLGLVIVKQAVELHGGIITVKSVENEGSTFTVALPMVPVEQGH